MAERKVIRGEKHHWWPKSLSKHWVNESGKINRIDSKGVHISAKPKEIGHISDAHNMIFPSDSSWETTIEHYFDAADGFMPTMVEWLSSFRTTNPQNGKPKYLRQEDESKELDLIRECIVSLIVRSPKFRNSIDATVKEFRGEIEKKESKLLIASNINQKYRAIVECTKGSGKFAVLFSDDKEFIYGDGIYTNMNIHTQDSSLLKAVVPITPNMVLIWSCPTAYTSNPRLTASLASEQDIFLINHSVQVYSKDYIFYRSQTPKLISSFKDGHHKRYEYPTDPLAKIINKLIPDESSNIYRVEPSICTHNKSINKGCNLPSLLRVGLRPFLRAIKRR